MIRQQIKHRREIYFRPFSLLLRQRLCFLLTYLKEKVMRQAAVSVPS